MVKRAESGRIDKALEPFRWHNREPRKPKKRPAPREAAEKIVDIFAAKKVRMKGSPGITAEERRLMANRIELTTLKGRRIPLLVQFGGAKTAKHCPYPEPDIAEYMALQSLARINLLIREVYPPGAKVRLMLGDTFYSYVFGGDKGVDPYVGGVERMVKGLGLSFINAQRFSDVVGAYGPSRVLDRCERNCELIRRHWDTGSQDAYNRLCDEGWKGTLPREQREYYANRAVKILAKKGFKGNALMSEKKSAVIRFMAYALMIAQFDLLDRRLETTVDVSFVPLAPGEPRSLYRRFRILAAPPGGTTKSAPPWTVHGVLRWPELKPTIYSYAEVDAGGWTCLHEASIKAGSYPVRADVFEAKRPPAPAAA